jgi:VanZ family protein
MRDPWIRTRRAAAWLLISAIAVMSFVPPAYRTVTYASHNVEHFSIFVATGVSFGVGYPNRPFVSGLLLLMFCAAIELAQQWVPGRHSRLGDFVVDAAAVCIGVSMAFCAARLHDRRKNHGKFH